MGSIEKGGGGQFKARVREGDGGEKKAEVPSTSQENTDSCEIQGWSPLRIPSVTTATQRSKSSRNPALLFQIIAGAISPGSQ